MAGPREIVASARVTLRGASRGSSLTGEFTVDGKPAGGEVTEPISRGRANFQSAPVAARGSVGFRVLRVTDAAKQRYGLTGPRSAAETVVTQTPEPDRPYVEVRVFEKAGRIRTVAGIVSGRKKPPAIRVQKGEKPAAGVELLYELHEKFASHSGATVTDGNGRALIPCTKVDRRNPSKPLALPFKFRLTTAERKGKKLAFLGTSTREANTSSW